MKKRSRHFIRASILPIVVSIPLAFIAAVVVSQIKKTDVNGEVKTSLSLQLVRLAPNLSAPPAPRTLSIADRVAYQYAIEEVYWRHRLWPNKESKPSLDEMMPAGQVQRKVEDYLRNSQLLADQWQRPITPEQIQMEMDRMANQTKQPEVLHELFAALNHDPTLIAECLARPALSDRLARELYAHDANFHGELKRRAESELRDHPNAREMKRSSGSYTEAEWIRSDDEDPTIREKRVTGDRLDRPDQVKLNATEWEANTKELASHLGKQDLNQVATGVLSELREEDEGYHATAILEKDKNRLKLASVTWQKEPFESWATRTKTKSLEPTNEFTASYSLPTIVGDSVGCVDGTWTPTSTINAPPGRGSATAVWTGAEMIVWGGQAGSSCCYLTSGGRYDPSTDSWVPMTTINAPSGRVSHTAVWTGNEMIIWGGYTFISNFQPLPNGGRYSPTTDSWVATSNTNAPAGGSGHSTVWTGNEMIVWGGSNGVQSFNRGWRYNPRSDSWVATSTNNAPSARSYQAAVWTGTEMIVWGGYSASAGRLNSGGKYDPSTDSWTATAMTGAPEKRSVPTAVWTGREMIVWGGNSDSLLLNTGGRYNPLTNTWVPTSIRICCDGRRGYSTIWTGYEMIVWGGSFGSSGVTYGEKYQPSTDTWLDITSVNEPSGRYGHVAVWTGNEMIVWGGSDNFTSPNTGGRFCAPPPPQCANDSWTATSLANAPGGRVNHTAVWTGSEMIVWGGQLAFDILNIGGRYDPAIDAWSPTSLTNAPTERIHHTAVWSGTDMIIWGGAPGPSNGAAVNTGGKYNPVTDAWVATSNTNAPTARNYHTAVWTINGMIIWGGVNNSGLLENTGSRYNSVSNNWSAISTANAPSARYLHTAVCTGNEMIVWGGASDQGGLNTGGKFNLNALAWSPTTTNNAPAVLSVQTAVWTGNEMIVWGSYGQSNGTGGKYNPVTDSWVATNITNAPKNRENHTAVWTGSDMIVWGGQPTSNTGGRYDPIADSWTATAIKNAPEGRAGHTAVWTGREMIVWGGGGGTSLGLNSGGRYCADPQIATASISGSTDYCPNPNLTPVADVTMSLTGAASASTLTDGSGNYGFAPMATNGNYEVTPRKMSLAPGSTRINTIDVLAVQRHFLGIVLLSPGCPITAGDVNEDGSINTLDLVAMQRFFLGLSTGIANVGQYRFNPAQRSYGALALDQTEQNYNALVLGDVAAAFVH